VPPRRSAGAEIAISRTGVLAQVEDALGLGGCVGLFGPRQVGKSALALSVAAARGSGAVRLDLRRPNHRARLTDSESFFADHAGKLVVLDEAHEMPVAFDIVHAQLEDQAHAGAPPTSFLILGSSGRAMRSLADDRLGARLMPVELGPIQAFELPSGRTPPTTTSTTAGLRLPINGTAPLTEVVQAAERPISFDRLWLRGGFPRSLLAETDEAAHRWRKRYLASCFGRETGAGSGAPATVALRETLHRIAAAPGSQMPYAKQSAEFRTSLDYLEHLGLVRRLSAWFTNHGKRLREPPKLYIRDSGLLHVLRDCRTPNQLTADNDLKGHSWESFCIEALASASDGVARPYFYRRDQDELDLLLDFGGRRWGIEIKLGEDPKPTARFYRACQDVGVEHRFIVHRGAESITVGDGVRALVLEEALSAVLAER
jgi:predicted AAA+ superfamily ATPase